jgi:hypothetical protein
MFRYTIRILQISKVHTQDCHDCVPLSVFITIATTDRSRIPVWSATGHPRSNTTAASQRQNDHKPADPLIFHN